MLKMPRGRTPQDVLNELKWVGELDETPWSKGVFETAEDLKREIGDLQEERKTLVTEIDEKVRKRMKLLRALPSRAEREAELVYTEEQIEAAKNGVLDVA